MESEAALGSAVTSLPSFDAKRSGTTVIVAIIVILLPPPPHQNAWFGVGATDSDILHSNHYRVLDPSEAITQRQITAPFFLYFPNFAANNERPADASRGKLKGEGFIGNCLQSKKQSRMIGPRVDESVVISFSE